MTVKDVVKNITTEFYTITRNGLLSFCSCEGFENEEVKKTDIICNICDGTPVTTCIRIQEG